MVALYDLSVPYINVQLPQWLLTRLDISLRKIGQPSRSAAVREMIEEYIGKDHVNKLPIEVEIPAFSPLDKFQASVDYVAKELSGKSIEFPRTCSIPEVLEALALPDRFRVQVGKALAQSGWRLYQARKDGRQFRRYQHGGRLGDMLSR